MTKPADPEVFEDTPIKKNKYNRKRIIGRTCI